VVLPPRALRRLIPRPVVAGGDEIGEQAGERLGDLPAEQLPLARDVAAPLAQELDPQRPVEGEHLEPVLHERLVLLEDQDPATAREEYRDDRLRERVEGGELEES
jgi:hypothetical protein